MLESRPAEGAQAGSFVVWLTTNPVSTWLIRNVCSPLDPLIFRASNGRFFSMGAPTGGMLTGGGADFVFECIGLVPPCSRPSP